MPVTDRPPQRARGDAVPCQRGPVAAQQPRLGRCPGALEESLRHLRQRRADAEQQLSAANPGLIVS
jgi:hypothetical protein